MEPLWHNDYFKGQNEVFQGTHFQRKSYSWLVNKVTRYNQDICYKVTYWLKALDSVIDSVHFHHWDREICGLCETRRLKISPALLTDKQ
jgi:hypothetical protein